MVIVAAFGARPMIAKVTVEPAPSSWWVHVPLATNPQSATTPSHVAVDKTSTLIRRSSQTDIRYRRTSAINKLFVTAITEITFITIASITAARGRRTPVGWVHSITVAALTAMPVDV